jgi:hypothetical protein
VHGPNEPRPLKHACTLTVITIETIADVALYTTPRPSRPSASVHIPCGRIKARQALLGLAAMGGNAFVYGTLMAPEVLKALINRVPPMKPAVIKGFRRYRVKGQVFPAIVPDLADSQVDGQVSHP